MLFGTDFCPPLKVDSELACDKDEEEGTAEPPAIAAAAAADAATVERATDVKVAEKSVLKDEGLTWHQHMIKPIDSSSDGEEGSERMPVAPDMNATQVECDRDCKVQKQLEKEAMETAGGSEASYDVHQVIKTGEEVTDKEAKGGINAERE